MLSIEFGLGVMTQQLLKNLTYKVQTKNFTNTPSHTFNMELFLRSKPAWENSIEVNENKIIILNIDSNFTLDDIQLIVIQIRLQELAKDFKLYVCHGGLLTPFVELELYEQFKQFTYHKDVNIIYKMVTSQLRLKHDAVFILNQQQLTPLILGDERDWYDNYHNQELNLIKSPIHPSTFNKLLRQHAHEIRSIVIQGASQLISLELPSDLALPKLERLVLAHQPQPKSIDNLSSLNNLRFSKQAAERILAASPNLTSVEIDFYVKIYGKSSVDFSLLTPLKNPQKLQNLSFTGGYNNEELDNILSGPLISLCLNFDKLSSKYEFDLRLLENKPLQKLFFKELHLINLSPTNFFQQKSKTLEELTLKNCTAPSPYEAKPTAKNLAIKKLTLFNSANFLPLINHCPMLENLTLEHNRALFELLTDNFPNLKSLTLKYEFFPWYLINKLLRHAIHLQHLSLSYENTFQFNGLISSKNLKKIHFYRIHLPPKKWQYFLEEASQMEILSLFDTNITLDNPINAQQLKEVNIGNQVSSSTLFNLCKNSPVTKLIIEDTQLEKCSFNFPNLTTLSINSTAINLIALMNLLKNSPLIHALTFRYNRIDEGNEIIFPDTLFSLPTFNYLNNIEWNNNDRTLDENILPDLLAHASRVKDINLRVHSTGSSFHSSFANTPFQLHELQSFTLQNPLSPKNLTNLLCAAKKLNHFFIQDYSPLVKLELKQSYFPALTTIDLNNITLSLDFLATLAQSAPFIKELLITGLEFVDKAEKQSVVFSELIKCSIMRLSISQIHLLSWLRMMPKLENLRFSSTACNDEGLEQQLAVQLPNLRSLFLADSSLSASAFNNLLRLAPNLEILSLLNTNISLKESNPIPLNKLNKLQISGAKNSPKINGSILQVILQQAENLMELDFKNTVIEGKFEKPHLPNLKTLKFQQIRLSYEHLEKIIQPQLTQIQLSNIIIEGKGFSKPLPLFYLEDLYLADLIGFKDEDIFYFIEHATTLKFFLHEIGPWVRKVYNNPKFSLQNIQNFNYVEGNGFNDCIDKLLKAAISSNPRKLLSAPISHPVPAPTKTSTPTDAISYAAPASLDADTHHNPNKQLRANVIFYGHAARQDPAVNFYRLRIFDDLLLTPTVCSIYDCFQLTRINPSPSLVEITAANVCDKKEILSYFSRLQAHSLNHFYGKITLQPSLEWQILPSLSPDEKLMAYASDALLEIRYCRLDNVYWVKLATIPTNASITFDFILQVPPKKSVNNLPQLIQEKIAELSTFNSNDLQLSSGMQGKDYLKAITQQKTGSCRHRSAVFFHWLTKKFPAIKSRIIFSEVHAFVEVCYQNQWIACDLGGYSFGEKIKLITSYSRPPSIVDSQFTKQGPSANIDLSPQFDINPSIESSQPQNRTPSMQPLVNSSPIDYFRKRKIPKYTQSPAVLIDRAIHYAGHALLIHTVAPGELLDALEKACKNQGYPFIVIDSAAELITSAPFIKPQLVAGKWVGMITPGPGGNLHDFLLKAPKNLRIIVNFDRFSAKEIAQFNKLIESLNPQADVTPLPDKSLIIGIQDPNKPDAYLKDDFLSRFAKPKPWICPFSAADFADNNSPFIDPPSNAHRLEFFNQDGIIKFTGGWEFFNHCFLYEESEVSRALKDYSHIILSNAPWHDREFRRFWQALLLHRSCLLPNGQRLVLPANIYFSQQRGYEWAKLLTVLTPPSKPFSWQDVVLVHQNNFNYLFKRYDYQRNLRTLTPTVGELNRFKNQSCSLYISSSLSVDAWAKLFSHCQNLSIALTVYYTAKDPLPEELLSHQHLFFPGPEPIYNPIFCCIKTNDRDYALKKLSLNKRKDILLDISEEDPGIVLGYIQPTIKASEQCFRLSQIPSPLSLMLKRKRVVLVGSYKPAMVDSLNSFMLQRYQNPLEKPHPLIIIDEQSSSWLPIVEQISWPVDAKTKETICPIPILPPQEYEHYSLSQLWAIKNFQQRLPQAPVSDVWHGLEDLKPERYSPTLPEFTEEEAEAITNKFYQERFNTLVNQFTHHRMAVISGKTGIGKTRFMLGFWRNKFPALHIGKEAILQWVKDQRKEGFIVLLLDEANTEGLDWSIFEAFLKLGIIHVNNKVYRLSPRHRVCFLVNPNNHGQRKTPSLFQRHGHCLVFSPFPLQFIYHEILRPILQNAGISDALTAVKPILQIAHFFNQLNQESILISAREFSMMLLLSLSYYQRHSKVPITTIINYYAWAIANPLVPSTKKAEFARLWPKTPCLDYDLPSFNSLSLNEANKPAARFVWEILELRKYRAAQPNLRGGIYRLNVVGEPGLGKTELIQALVQAQKMSPEAENPQLKYYSLSASLNQDILQEKLQKASEEGALVIIDEVNTATLSEEFMNNLEEQKGFNQSFFILGTLNPPEKKAGRKVDSMAAERRNLAIEIRPYNSQEMAAILRQKNLPENTVNKLIADYTRNIYEQNDLCFRDLIKKASEIAYEQIKPQWDSILRQLKTQQIAYQNQNKSTIATAFANLRKNLNKETELFRLGHINFSTFKTNCLTHKRDTLSLLPKSLSMLDVFIKMANFFATVCTFGIAQCIVGNSPIFRAPANQEEVLLNGIDYGLACLTQK